MTQQQFSIEPFWLQDQKIRTPGETGLADIRITVAGNLATELEDLTEGRIRDCVRAATETLATWFAANWWRLRWEPADNNLSVQMSHRMGAAGKGYAWPDLEFSSDGEWILVSSRPTPPTQREPVRFLNHFDAYIRADDFELGVDKFMQAVLDHFSPQETILENLKQLWMEVTAEREDPRAAVWRKMEALLGYDPDEAPENVMTALQDAAQEYGQNAVDELAVAGRTKVLSYIQDIRERILPKTASAQLKLIGDVRFDHTGQSAGPLPWQRGEAAAKATRKAWGMPEGPVDNQTLGDLFCMDPRVLDDCEEKPEPLFAAGFREEPRSGKIRVFLDKRRSTGRRFAMARLAGDLLHNSEGDHLLPATMATTARQKFQRAFARELLCPMDSLASLFPDSTKIDDEAMEDAAIYFQVSPHLINTTLVNKGILPRDTLPE
jgi:hypothetical protein